MGVEYYIVDRKNMRRFDLGKTFHFDIFLLNEGIDLSAEYGCEEHPIVYTSLAILAERLSPDWWAEDKRADWADWVRTIARKLWAFAMVADWNLERRNDCYDYADSEDAEGNYVGRDVHVECLSVYTDAELALDPCAEKQAMWEKVALLLLPDPPKSEAACGKP